MKPLTLKHFLLPAVTTGFLTFDCSPGRCDEFRFTDSTGKEIHLANRPAWEVRSAEKHPLKRVVPLGPLITNRILICPLSG